MQTINQTQNNCDEGEAQFRVHFYLEGIYYSCEKRLQNFLDQISQKLSETLSVQFVQINGSIKKYVDISVGLKSDEAAYKFLMSSQKLTLPGERLFVEYEPKISQSFKMQESIKQDFAIEKKSIVTNLVLLFKREFLKEQQFREYLVLTSSILEINSWILQGFIDNNRTAMKYATLYIFGVPLSYKEQDIVHVLNQHRIKFRYVEWKLRQDIQYLFVQLSDSMSLSQISNLDLFVDRYPLLTTTKLKDDSFNDVLLRHQIQLTFDKDIDEVQFMKFSHKIGGIISLIKDEYNGPRKYIVALNNLSRLKKYEEEIVNTFKGVKLNKPRYPVRLSRLQRTFTYVHMMDNLVFYEKQLEKMNDLEPHRAYI